MSQPLKEGTAIRVLSPRLYRGYTGKVAIYLPRESKQYETPFYEVEISGPGHDKPVRIQTQGTALEVIK